MADLIMARVTLDIEELKEIVAIEPEITQDFSFNKEHEIRFHGKLYEVTGNENMKNSRNYSCRYLLMCIKELLKKQVSKTNMYRIKDWSISLNMDQQKCLKRNEKSPRESICKIVLTW